MVCPRYGFEICKDTTCDMIGDEGFILAIQLLKRLRPSSLVHFAPVCSSWTWVNRGTAKRSRLDPLGDTSLAYVREANRMVARVVMLALMCSALGHVWVLEQPSSSLMDAHPKFDWLLRLGKASVLRVCKVKTWMGMFGGGTPKPTTLWGNPLWLEGLQRKYCKSEIVAEVSATEKYEDSSGKTRVKGTKDLKSTQSAAQLVRLVVDPSRMANHFGKSLACTEALQS